MIAADQQPFDDAVAALANDDGDVAPLQAPSLLSHNSIGLCNEHLWRNVVASQTSVNLRSPQTAVYDDAVAVHADDDGGAVRLERHLPCCTSPAVCASSMFLSSCWQKLARHDEATKVDRFWQQWHGASRPDECPQGHNSEDTRKSTHATHRAATTVQRGSYSRTLCVHTPKGTTVSHYLFVGSRFACLP